MRSRLNWALASSYARSICVAVARRADAQDGLRILLADRLVGLPDVCFLQVLERLPVGVVLHDVRDLERSLPQRRIVLRARPSPAARTGTGQALSSSPGGRIESTSRRVVLPVQTRDRMKPCAGDSVRRSSGIGVGWRMRRRLSSADIASWIGSKPAM